jgi:Integrase core domain.
MGPARTESLGGKRYTLVMVDDFSRFSFVRFLREKSDSFEMIVTLCKKIQNEKECTIVRVKK